jgi:RNA polymerase sigma factor (sigma-70 family)
MPDLAEEFDTLMMRVRLGDEVALEQLVQRYESEIRLTARVLLRPLLRPYLDSVDLVQSVHRRLMLGLRENKFDISSPEKLVGLAVTMVRHKIGEQWRHLQRQTRLDDSGTDTAEQSALLTSLSSPQPGPAQTAQYNDLVRHLYAQVTDTERRVIELRLQGYSTVEVANELGITADVLRVRLHRLRQRLRDRNLLAEWV